jgi:hypothetical protein
MKRDMLERKARKGTLRAVCGEGGQANVKIEIKGRNLP